MTEARVEKVYADRLDARTRLAQAEKFQTDAEARNLSTESRSVLLHNAAISASNAILQAAGVRVTSGDGSHLLRLDVAGRVEDRPHSAPSSRRWNPTAPMPMSVDVASWPHAGSRGCYSQT